MAYRTSHPVVLTDEQRGDLQRFIATGRHHSREIIRATILLRLDRGIAATAVADQLDITYQRVNETRKKFVAGGLDRALYDAPRSGAPPKVSQYTEADITLLACSPCPQGYGHWTMRLLSDRMGELGYPEGVSKSNVERILKKAKSSRGKKLAGASDRSTGSSSPRWSRS